MKTLICIDFDGVLFNAGERIGALPILKKVAGQDFHDALAEFRKQSEFLPAAFCDLLASRGLLSREEAGMACDEFSGIQRDAASLVFDDAREFLRAFSKDMLAIVSRAHPEWQLPNIRNAGLAELVGRIFVTQGDFGKREAIRNLREEYERVFHIDDSTAELERIGDLPGVVPIFLNRRRAPGEQGYASLREIARYLQSAIASE